MNRFSAFRLPKHLRTPFLLSFLLSCVLGLSFLVVNFTTQPVLPIFYSLRQADAYLAPKEWMVVFPILSFIITFLHLYLLRFVRKYERVIQELFMWTTVIFQFLLALAFFRIIWIVS